MLSQNSELLAPYKLGDLQLKNRLVVAPLTRMRGDKQNGIPNDLMVEHYAQRADYGLILTECSQISPISNCFPGSGGIYSKEQIEGWKKVTQKVHEKGGVIFLQIWHCGRQTNPELIGGETPISSSAIAVGAKNPVTQTDFPVPREMTVEDIKEVIEQFRQGAKNAKEAGFDGVELHSANGYLVDQFLRDGCNKRTDNYGGSIENRARFLLEVLDALISVFGSKRVGVRFSPTGRYGGMYDSNPLELMKYVLKEVEKKDLLFVELKRHGDLERNFQKKITELHKVPLPSEQIPYADFFKTLRPLYNGILIGNDGLTPESAEQGIKDKEFELASFGALSIANPDLPERIRIGAELNKPEYATYYAEGATGYTDYPLLQKQ